ncbi:MAG: hypothetical protein RDA78_23625 [Roseibium sp.]|uniref:hypothetical protein n=1 Tax=Roseibium sp. TaxID=1936156 RepID=UPI003D9C016B
MGQSSKIVFSTKIYLIAVVASRVASTAVLFVDEEPDALQFALRGIIVWFLWLVFTYGWLNNIERGFRLATKKQKYTWPAFMAVTAPFAMAVALVLWASTYAESAGVEGTLVDEFLFMATTFPWALYDMFSMGFYFHALSVVLELGVWLVYPIWALWFWSAAKDIQLQDSEPDAEVFN